MGGRPNGPSAVDDTMSDKLLIATIADPEGNAISLVEERPG
jgi:hypothetical protein